MEDLTGKQFGPYQIVAPLGEGGMAAVYKAYQPAMERYVALKVLPRHLADDPEFITRFQREAKLLAQLQHPHILPVFDYGQADGYTYIVMPFVESGTLTNSLNGQPVPLPRLRQVISQVGEALNYAHARGLIHRDVKPSNVLVDESKNCLLTDFGLARMVATSDNLTATGAMMGTPAYMSPEQGTGQAADARSDIYSLGVILYELATGRVPYKAETPIAVVFKHIQDPLPLARTLNPELPEAVERVILKALSKRPEDRYQTAGEMVRALQAAIPETATTLANGIERPSAPTVVARPKRALPLWVWGLMSLIVVVIIGGLFVAFGRGTPASPSGLPTPVSLLGSGVPLPPGFAGNIRSAKASYGCGVLLGVTSNNDEQLAVCGSMPSLPPEWITKVKRVNIDCATLASDRIIVEVWTEANYTGETWSYTFDCPTPAVSPSGVPTPVSFLGSSEPLPPEVAGHIRSAKASFGCGVLLGVTSNNDEQLSVCGLMPSLPPEWITKVKRVNIDCATLAGDYILVELWTEPNYTGDGWYRAFDCPTLPTPTPP